MRATMACSNAENSAEHDEATVDHHYRQLLRKFNSGQRTRSLLEAKSSQRGFGDTLREMDNLALANVDCKPVSNEVVNEPGAVLQEVGGKNGHSVKRGGR